MAEVIVDTEALKEMGKDIDRAKDELLLKLAQRGFNIMQTEVPTDTTRLKHGIASPSFDKSAGTAEIVVNAQSEPSSGGTAQVIGPDGKVRKTVTLRPSPRYNYADAVARGRPSISPSHGRALLIPVLTTPSGESYLLKGGRMFVLRKSAKAVPANPYDERTAVRLQREAPDIADAVMRKFFK